MPVTKEQLAAIIGGRAREMCSVQNDKKLNEMAGRVNIDSGYFDDPDPYTYNDGGAADKFDAMLGFGTSDGDGARDMQYNQASANASRMPDAIKNSMLNERIDVTKLGTASVLDGMNIPAPKQRRGLNEHVTMAPAPQPTAIGGVVDYSIIKAIVNECLDSYFANKQPLNESTGSIKTIGLAKGYISIVDNKGDIYKAKLEKVGNKNDKQ